MERLSPELLMKAYSLGVFPMADAHDDDEIFFLDPDERGVLPLDGVHIPRSLRKKIRQQPYVITVDQAFDDVIDACRTITADRTESWINPTIRASYCDLHQLGFAHSIEAWQKDDGQDVLVGGLYGVALKGAFFGESMFSRATDASKIALIHLMARLKAGGFTLLDTQFTNPHLEQFGVLELPRDEFKARLRDAMMVDAHLPIGPQDMTVVQSFLQANTETS